MYEILGIIVVAILIILYICCKCFRSVEDSLLTGKWIAPSSFCQEAGIMWMCLSIDESPMFSSTRQCVIIIADDGIESDQYLLYDAVDISFQRSISFAPYLSNCIEYTIDVDWANSTTDGSNIFPSKQKAYFYPKTGKLVFGDNKQITAILYKDNILSSVYNSDLPSDAFEHTGSDDVQDIESNLE